MSDAAELATVPRIPEGLRLQWEEAQGCHVLLYPEGMVKLNASAGAILARCDGRRPLREIVTELEQAFATPALAADVLAFADLARRQGWLRWEAA